MTKEKAFARHDNPSVISSPDPRGDDRASSMHPETVRESALNALLAWNAARQEVNRLRTERNNHRCTERQIGDTENMCEPCKARQKLNEPIAWAKRKASELRQKMQRQAARLAKRDDK
jgi:hypothetical protein